MPLMRYKKGCGLLSVVMTVLAATAAPAQPLFTLRPPAETGLAFENRLTESAHRNVIQYPYYYNGGGVAVGDVNGDDLPDLFLTGNLVQDRLYLNRGGWRFEDVTEAAGLVRPPGPSWSTGAAMMDLDADGDLDLHIARSGNLQPENRRNLVYLNDGTGRFTEAGAALGLDHAGYTIHAAQIDYDRDGDLDVFVLNHGFGRFDAEAIPRLRAEPDPYRGDRLFENRAGTFVDVTDAAGLTSTAFGFGLGVAVADLDGDGWDDLYVSNDFFEHDYLYLNNRDGTFREVVKEATRHLSNFSMGNDVADVNGDGYLDVMVLDMVAEDNRRLKANMSGMDPATFWSFVEQGYHYQYMFNTLHLNHGPVGPDGVPTFSDVAQLAGVATTDWSWAPLFADFDHDGWPDLYVTNGLRKEARNTDFVNYSKEVFAAAAREGRDVTEAEWADLLARMPSEAVPNYAFRNGGDLTFADASADWGLDQPSFSNGAATADLDRDGDLDLVVSTIDAPPLVYENHAADRGLGRWLRVRLEGPEGNRFGLGAKVRVRTADGREQFGQFFTSRGYQSSVEPVLHVGLGEAETADVVVDWPDGRRSTMGGVAADGVLAIRHADATAATPPAAVASPLFAEATDALGLDFVHREDAHDDFATEVLLPHKMSTFGPGLATGDVDGDGRADVYVGGATGQSGELFLQEPDGTFRATDWSRDAAHEDLGALFFDADGDGDLDLYVVSGGAYRTGAPQLQDRLYRNDGRGGFTRDDAALPDLTASGSRVRAADYDGDGDLDLFVGGRHLPSQYPRPAQSAILENVGGTFRDATADLAPELQHVGMVTDAAWTDPDGDGDLDLMVVGEWLPITLFEQRIEPDAGRRFVRTEPLPNTNGWWFSLAAADLDGDGDDDYVAGNLGLNYKYKASAQEPFRVYSDDFDGNGSRDIVLSYYSDGTEYPLRGRSCSSQQIPALKKKFPTYTSFAAASLRDVYGSALEQSLIYDAHTFASLVLMNEDGRLVPHALPNEAQASNVNDALVRDVDGDGAQDLVLAFNLYGSEIETTRNDAGIGLVLRGDGRGGFEPLPVAESGFFLPYDVKDLTWIETPQGAAVVAAANDDRLRALRLRGEQ